MAGTSAKITFDARQLKQQVNEILDRKIKAVKADPEVGQTIHTILADMSFPYVPYKTGRLRDSADPQPKYVKYAAYDPKNGYNYAGYQHNLRQWEQDMLAVEGSEFARRVAECLSEKMNEV